MFSYQHRYHAGNFADLHKHVVLIALLEHLQKKPTPFGVLDAFAGEGLYNLKCSESLKTQEYTRGYGKICGDNHLPPLFEKLQKIGQRHQTKKGTLIYPGSPTIIQSYLREQDVAHCVELHPQAVTHLNNQFKNHPQMHIHERDSYEAMNALIPFPQKRGLVLIDPSYEVKEEYRALGKFVSKLHRKFSHGIFQIWYPLLKAGLHESLISEIRDAGITNIWQSEWIPCKPGTHDGLVGSGLIVINPPFQIQSVVKEQFDALRKTHFPEGHLRTVLFSNEL